MALKEKDLTGIRKSGNHWIANLVIFKILWTLGPYKTKEDAIDGRKAFIQRYQLVKAN